ncbi:MBL fold metallo-hydrolase [Desulforhopalus singaporensis]|uniref:Phosphoribosyl 1,2-cyclic phosphodiesterase n=1 Tax=Desulforhopalus singaporensis TaxID=91360 RepID=A0A1H0J9M1_9BACT|nr:MBL fold metallo-hydrolase [Desulforhopalus singaporensis]SDO40427.1 Phosphoribosyl 1,2-cyclic phosphodiesterase [Desulforhopalus singaporensis]
MRFSVLGSGSRGNAVYIESGGSAILIDAGFSGKEMEKRLALIGRNLQSVAGICLTHEHNDHIKGAGVLSRRLKVPLYANYGTLASSEKTVGKVHGYREFETGDTFQIGDLQVRSFRISHDSADPVGFVISDRDCSLGYLTDTGKVSHLMESRLTGCSGLILEFNHNLDMLKNGPYPLPLQQRVRSSLGHLCNEDAADFLDRLLPAKKLRHVVLAHLSEQNNTPQLAVRAYQESKNNCPQVRGHVASQGAPTAIIEL